MEHKTVLLKELVELAAPLQNKVIIDATLGGGGHSLKILNIIDKGELYVFDLDQNAIHSFKNHLGNLNFIKNSDNQFKKDSLVVNLLNKNFSEIDSINNKADAIIADLGWASYQLDSIEGLSYQNEESELDMRFNQDLLVKASDLLNALGAKELEQLFRNYSDLKFFEAKNLTKKLIEYRKNNKFIKVKDLNTVLNNSKFSSNKEKSRIYQGLRIAVNGEYQNLKQFLQEGFEILNNNGRFLIITFHSGEEKIVQEFFDKQVKNNKAEYITQNNKEKFIRPSTLEVTNNIRSRSAKLFGIEKSNL